MKKNQIFLSVVLFWGNILFAMDNCPFCKPDILARQLVHETDYVAVLYCLTPATKGNLLIVPKRHIERFEQLMPEEMLAVQKEINLFSQVFVTLYEIPEFVVIQKNGKKAGQSVSHLHFHMIPAPKAFHEIIDTAFNLREKISDEEMKIRTQELQGFLKDF